MQAARAALAPELYNRIDEVLVFAPLGRDDVREITRRLLDGMGIALAAQRGVELEYGPELIEYLMDAGGFEPSLGDRGHPVVDQRRFGDDIMTVYSLREVPCSPA